MVHDPLRPQGDDPGQAHDSEGGERIAKLLARAGVGSRRDVERLIAEGRVAINGRTLDTPAVKVEPGDIVTVDSEVVGEPEPARLFRYHKPVGLVTTHKDPAGRPTVFQALPEGLPRLISVGRLDINSEGLLLLTNDGELARALEMPSTAVVRRYRARAHGRTTQEKLDTLKNGITVDGVRYGPVEAKLDKAKDGPAGANLWLTVTLHEGKNREVRRVLEALGLKVNRLIRLAYGPLALGTLGVGELEEVGPRVVREQFAEHIDEANLPTGERPLYRSPRKSASRRAQEEAKIEADLAPARGPKEKPVYKAGWAKPKPKAAQPLKDKAAAKSREAAKSRPVRKAKSAPAARATAPTRPGIIDKPPPGGLRPARPARAAGPGGPRPSASPRTVDRPPASGSRPARAAPAAGPREPKPSASPRTADKPAGGSRPARAAPATGGPRGPKPSASPRTGDKAPAGGFKPARSAPAPGPAAGPRGPKPSASPRRTPGARPPGPPKPGGPRRRG